MRYSTIPALNAALAAALAVTLIACGKDEAPAPQPAPQKPYAERMAEEHAMDKPVASPAAQQEAAAAVKSQTVTYGTVGDSDLEGYLAYPADAEGGLPAVLVFHEWWGLNDNIRSMADQLAGEGYVALALDMYGGQVAEDREAAYTLMKAAMESGEAIAQNIAQGHAFLKNEIKATRTGSIGWCFGGGLSLEAGTLLEDQLDAVVIYYGHVGGDAEKLKSLRAPVLGLFGEKDEGIPLDSVKAFEAALQSLEKPAEIKVYPGADHAFANPSGTNYQAEAAEDAWQRALEFLATHLKDG